VYGSTAKLKAGEEELDGEDADRRRRLDSSTSHQQQLQRRPGSSRTRRPKLAELGRFQGREEERRARKWCSGGVVFCGVEWAFL
jgi:hypothetical protein